MTPSYARYLSLLAALLLLAVAPPVTAQINYDTNDNRLIDKLNAMRYDSNGNGLQDGGGGGPPTAFVPTNSFF